MAFTSRGRRTRYDNIARGEAISSQENTILGNTVSRHEVYGGGYVVSTSDGEMDISNIQNDGVSVTNAVPGPESFKNADGGTTDPTDENPGSSNTAGFVTNP